MAECWAALMGLQMANGWGFQMGTLKVTQMGSVKDSWMAMYLESQKAYQKASCWGSSSQTVLHCERRMVECWAALMGLQMANDWGFQMGTLKVTQMGSVKDSWMVKHWGT